MGTSRLREVYELLKVSMKREAPDFEFHAIQLNRNLECKKHADKGNASLSAIIGFGDFSGGGELVLRPKGESDGQATLHDVRHHLI